MIGVIRVRFNETNPALIWSDEVMRNWLDPFIPFSLAHYWTRTSFFQLDMRYHLFAPIAIADPRQVNSDNDVKRRQLVDAVTYEVYRTFLPDWNVFDRLIIWFAQQTDLFGGGAFLLQDQDIIKYVPVAVCDIHSQFSQVCQEVGHAFGYEHERDRYSGQEYTSPYSCMSGEIYGGAQSSFNLLPGARPFGANMPKGVNLDVNGPDPQLIIGPYITPVQLYVNETGNFIDSRTVYFIPQSYETAPHSFSLTALDEGISKWPLRKQILAVLPPILPNDDVYFLELRRSESYDLGFTDDGSNFAPIALVLHSADLKTKRISYVNRIPLISPIGDRDYHCFHGHFTVRLNSVADDFSTCSVTVGGGNFWQYFGINLEIESNIKFPIDPGDWFKVMISPCELYQESFYHYRYQYYYTTIVINASTFGYEKPHYQWFLESTQLYPEPNFTHGNITLEVNVRVPIDHELSMPQKKFVDIFYEIKGTHLTLVFKEKYADVHMMVKTIVNESSTEVIPNNYPDRTIWTDITFNNAFIEWEQAYKNAKIECMKKKLKEKRNTRAIPKKLDGQPNPYPKWDVNPIELINSLIKTNPVAANEVIAEISRLGNIDRLEIIKNLQDISLDQPR